MSDSAGRPWQGRHFEPNPSADDDGSAPERLIEAIRRFHSNELAETDVLTAVRGARLLIPLVAQLGAGGIDEGGGEKSQELSIVTVAAPDGRAILPAFTSVDAMSAWNPAARPVPATAERVALAAAGEGTDLVVLDATSDTEFVIRRPALWALAQSRPWVPSYLDTEVLAAFMDAAEPEASVIAVQLAPGDRGSRLAGPELIVQLSLVAGLDRNALAAVIARLRSRWSESEVITTRVDSLRVQLDPV